ncbi:MAG: hypothetical protein JW861_07280 [Bacteroidales bacterium]|nr:hypothetical protein [Bacteroidales bacterium]
MEAERRHEDQRITGGREATGDYVREAESVFRACLRDIFAEVAGRCAAGNTAIPEELRRQARECCQAYFRTMKGGINITEEEVMQILDQVALRQQKLIRFLDSITGEFRKYDVRFEVLGPDQIVNDPYWDTGPEPGRNIRTDNQATLYACPLYPAMTNCYMALQQEPVAAHLIWADPGGMIFIGHDQDPGEKFMEAYRNIFPSTTEVTDEIPEAWSAQLMKDRFLVVSSENEYTQDELEKLGHNFGVIIVQHGNFGNFTARMVIDNRYKIPDLLNEFLH